LSRQDEFWNRTRDPNFREGEAVPYAPATDAELELLDSYWRAANYLSVGQIYLLDNPLLREPLRPEHIKPRLLGHWGTTPGLNLLYAHLNRAITARDLNAIYITGPGHGGPGLVANAYLEGTYSEVYAHIPETTEGLRRLFRQFSFPGGIPSHVAPETPGSIHEGGELGYAIVHAYGAVFDNPDLLALCVVGDGEAETGPLATSWHSNKFLDPARDGAVLPVLHLNGYKIANPTVLARIPEEELADLMRGYGYAPHLVTGDDPTAVHRELADTLDRVLDDIDAIQRGARAEGNTARARSTACRSRTRSARIKCRWPAPAPTTRTASSSRPGCAATDPRNCSPTTACCVRSFAPSRRPGSGG
jgi:xylulose-5-phosphate/fructose-6-phosphate phosphoketolase